MPIDDIGQVTPIPDYDPNEDINSGSTGATSGTNSNIAGYDVTNEPLAPNLILNREQSSVGIYTPVLTQVSNGYQLSWTNNAGLPNPAAVIISNGTNGTDGTDGTDGLDGVTYTPHIAEIANGIQITFTNDGERPNPSPVEIYNGADGAQGPQGEPGPAGADGTDGEDGFSPVATVTKSGTIITITITDANGTTTQSFDTAVGVAVNYNPYDDVEEDYITESINELDIVDDGPDSLRESQVIIIGHYGNNQSKDFVIGKPISYKQDDVEGNITGIEVTGEKIEFDINNGDDTGTIYGVPMSGGAIGYVLTKTASGYEWQAAQGGGGGITPTVIIGNQAYPATALQFDPSINAFTVQANGSYFGYVVPNTRLYEAAQQGNFQLKDILINLDTGVATLTDIAERSFTMYLIPSGGSTGQVLTKSSGGTAWGTPRYVPTSGTEGQVLTKYGSQDDEYYWADMNQVPSGNSGNIGQFLKKYGANAGQYMWDDINQVPSGGTQGQVLTKGASGYAWETPSSGGGATFGISSDQMIDQNDTVIAVGGNSNTLSLQISGDRGIDTGTLTIGDAARVITLSSAFSNYIGAMYDLGFKISYPYLTNAIFKISDVYRYSGSNGATLFNDVSIVGDMTNLAEEHQLRLESPSNVAWVPYTIKDSNDVTIGTIYAPASITATWRLSVIHSSSSGGVHEVNVSVTPILIKK